MGLKTGLCMDGKRGRKRGEEARTYGAMKLNMELTRLIPVLGRTI